MEQDISHMPAASLGQYASLSFVVMGRSEIINSGFWIADLEFQILVYFRHFRHSIA